MTSFARIGKAAGVFVGASAGLAGLGVFAALRRPLPRTTGTFKLPGLRAPVEVVRDRWGVPHIYAADEHDLFAAQGYVHAQDRLWQMEFQRRLAHGQLAEIFGEVALPSDRFIRILGFSRVARRETDQLDAETRAALEAYVHGVNTYVAQHARRLPIEFSVLRLQPRPWQLVDVVVWGKIMALNLSENWALEVLRAQIVAAVGPERAAQLDPLYRDDHPLTVPHGAHYSTRLGADTLRLARDASLFTGSSDNGQGSNAWVVDGTRTASKQPLLANDPHLALQIPALWYENHLVGGRYQVTGVSIPGAPGVLIGHNAHIAWGLTNAMTDVQDVYIEQFDPADPTRYRVNDAWQRAEVVREEIRVRGRATSVVEEVRITRHGPVVSPLVSTTADRRQGEQSSSVKHQSSSIKHQASIPQEALALRWTALEPGTVTRAVLKISQAANWEQFRAALADWTVPVQNFVYADVDGHIGYALGGAVPLRAAGAGRLPVPGWTDEYEWTGTIPPEALPYALDPADGAIVSANNRIVGADYPHPLPSEWLSGYRAARIHELLEQTTEHSMASFARMHVDLRSLPGLELAALAGRLPASSVTAQHARDALATWDGELTTGSVGGTIYARLRENLLAAAYAEISGPLELVTGLGALASMPGSSFLTRALPKVLQRAAQRDDDWLPGARTWRAVLHDAWETTIAQLRDEFGDDVQAWQYGRWHRFTLRHPLGAVPALARLLNRGPFPTGGDIDTVWMGYLPRRYAGAPFYVGPSYRHICDPSNWDRSRSMYPTGQSGHPASRHYADFTQPWLKGEYHPMLWSRERVDESAMQRLTLQP